jgi:hypothetical protein
MSGTLPADRLAGESPAAAAAPTTTVDVAIVAYRRWELTNSCLAHLHRQSIATHRIFLCDNG